MGVLESTMSQMGYEGDLLNALKILSGDKSKEILNAVAMAKSQSKPRDFADVQSYTPNQPELNPEDVMGQANQMVQPQTNAPSAALQARTLQGLIDPTQLNNPSGQLPVPQNNSPMMSLIQKYFPRDQWDNAYKVMMGESGGRPGAVGDNYPIRGQTIPSYGLFQIRALPGRPDPKLLMDPEFNVKYAAEMWAKQGWQPWSFAKKIGLK